MYILSTLRIIDNETVDFYLLPPSSNLKRRVKFKTKVYIPRDIYHAKYSRRETQTFI